jgi:hypothetical protein
MAKNDKKIMRVYVPGGFNFTILQIEKIGILFLKMQFFQARLASKSRMHY